MWTQDKYVETLVFAATVHGDQKVPSKPYSYVVHLCNVAQEIMGALTYNELNGILLDGDTAVQCALLHDVIEDAGITYEEVKQKFSSKVADGVFALTKNNEIEKSDRMKDSLTRIKQQPKEVWMVKLADRITNLQPPPTYWTKEKIKEYYEEAKVIYDFLKDGDQFLGNRLKRKIENYTMYL